MIEFEARTAANVLIATFQTAEQAAAWTLENEATYPGMFVEEVRRYERRKVIYRAAVAKAQAA